MSPSLTRGDVLPIPEATWRRHPADVARLVFALLVGLGLVVVGLVYRNTVVGLAADLVRLVDNVPGWLTSFIVGLLQLLAVVAPLVLAVALVARRRFRVLSVLVAAAGGRGRVDGAAQHLGCRPGAGGRAAARPDRLVVVRRHVSHGGLPGGSDRRRHRRQPMAPPAVAPRRLVGRRPRRSPACADRDRGAVLVGTADRGRERGRVSRAPVLRGSVSSSRSRSRVGGVGRLRPRGDIHRTGRRARRFPRLPSRDDRRAAPAGGGRRARRTGHGRPAALLAGAARQGTRRRPAGRTAVEPGRARGAGVELGQGHRGTRGRGGGRGLDQRGCGSARRGARRRSISGVAHRGRDRGRSPRGPVATGRHAPPARHRSSLARHRARGRGRRGARDRRLPRIGPQRVCRAPSRGRRRAPRIARTPRRRRPHRGNGRSSARPLRSWRARWRCSSRSSCTPPPGRR